MNSHILGDVEKVADRILIIVNGKPAGMADRSDWPAPVLKKCL